MDGPDLDRKRRCARRDSLRYKVAYECAQIVSVVCSVMCDFPQFSSLSEQVEFGNGDIIGVVNNVVFSREKKMSNQTQFAIGRVENIVQQSQEIGNTTRHIVGVRSAEVTCLCGHNWIATEQNGLISVIGGHIVTCPVCNASEQVHLRTFHAKS